MVRYKQPVSLYEATHTWVCRFIGDRLVSSGYDSPAQHTLKSVSLLFSVLLTAFQKTVFRICKIRMFWGLLDPDP
jgi:hypothetical protein